MPDKPRKPLTDSLRRILDRGKEAPGQQRSQAAEPTQPEPVASAEAWSPPSALAGTLGTLSLQEFLRYMHVLSAAATDAAELDEAQAEVDRRLVDAQDDADAGLLQDAARQLERRRLRLDRLLGQPRPGRPRDDGPRDDGPGCGVICMCSAPDPPEEELQPLGAD